MSATITTIIAIIAGIASISPLYPIIWEEIRFRRSHKLKITSKSGRSVVYDLKNKNGIEKVLLAADILLER